MSALFPIEDSTAGLSICGSEVTAQGGFLLLRFRGGCRPTRLSHQPERHSRVLGGTSHNLPMSDRTYERPLHPIGTPPSAKRASAPPQIRQPSSRSRPSPPTVPA